MQNLKILNKREIKKIFKELKEVYGVELKLNFAFFRSSKDKIYILSKKFSDLKDKNLRINNLGLYFGKFEKDGIRLSIEGVQLVKPKKNILELSDKEIDKWIRGEDLKTDKKLKGYVAIKNKNDFYGVGKCKEGKVLNYIPKDRRITKLSMP